MSNTVLVTGATGKTGSEVVKQLIGKHEAVKAAAHSPEKAATMFGPGVEIAPSDFGRPETFEPALKGIDRIYLLAVTGDTSPQVAMMAGLFESVRRGWAAHVSPDVANVLGRPPITLEQFAQDYAAVWRSSA